MFKRVDLPEPEGPTILRNSCSFTRKLIFFKIVIVPELVWNDLLMSLSLIMGF
jgi:hypothetical protein